MSEKLCSLLQPLSRTEVVIYTRYSEPKAEEQEEEVGGACEKETGPRVCVDLKTGDGVSSHIHPKPWAFSVIR